MSFLSKTTVTKTTVRVACIKSMYRWAGVPYFAAQA